MTLLNAEKNQPYTITQILPCDELLRSRFFQLGFIPGSELILRRKAPVFGDPLLFEIGDSQIAITKSEAILVEIEAAKEVEA
jgi:Fe2+ transport system protein FeoA